MIEFFEFLNTCSPARVVTYLIFIVVITFVIFAGISDIIGRLKNNNNNKNKPDIKTEEEIEDTNG